MNPRAVGPARAGYARAAQAVADAPPGVVTQTVALGPPNQEGRNGHGDQVLDYTAQAFEDAVSDVDVVLDTVGDDTQARSFGVLRRGGYLASTVSPPDEALATAHGVTASFVFHQSDAGRLARLLDMVAAGKLVVLADRTASLDGLPYALSHQASGRARGKIVLTM